MTLLRSPLHFECLVARLGGEGCQNAGKIGWRKGGGGEREGGEGERKGGREENEDPRQIKEDKESVRKRGRKGERASSMGLSPGTFA